MKYFFAFGTAMLGLCLLNTGTQCVAQTPSKGAQLQTVAWQDHDHDQDRDHDRNNDHDRDHDRANVPSGSYAETCRDIRVNGDRIEATCDNGRGKWRQTSLDNFQRCNSEIVNLHGHLSCNK
jgi:hypothetical protein